MTEENKDVDLYKELENELNKSEVEDTSGASAEKPKDEGDPSKEVVEAELSEEEISKLSPRAQKRIRDLASQVKELAEKPKDETPEEKKDTPQDDDENEKATPKFNNVKEFLDAVQDAPSRKLLESFYNVIKGETSTILAPIETKNNEAKFDSVFSRYEKVEGMTDHKGDLKKTFMRNPSQDLDALLSKKVSDLVLNKVKPVEDTPSTPNREGKVNLDDLDLDNLYDELDKTRT